MFVWEDTAEVNITRALVDSDGLYVHLERRSDYYDGAVVWYVFCSAVPYPMIRSKKLPFQFGSARLSDQQAAVEVWLGKPEGRKFLASAREGFALM